MGKVRSVLSCRDCGQQLARWAGRCPGCGAWGTIEEGVDRREGAAVELGTLAHDAADEQRVSSGLPGVDRVLGGGLVPSTVALLAGEPGIGKSTLLLQIVASLSAAGLPCLFAAGEESRRQVSARAHRLGIDGSDVAFVAGRELATVVDAARTLRPAMLAVDSIQSLREPSAAQLPGGPSQVRGCADALVGFAKAEGISVVVTGHVTKDGDLAGPRALEHAVDVVLAFDGDPRSGLRRLSAGKNRFGAEGEVAWFEMTGSGLHEIDPGHLLLPGGAEPGAATALPLAGRRAFAVEVQALVAGGEGVARRQASGVDLRRFQLVCAVLDHAGLGLGRSDVFAATAGGARLDDPACDLAVAAAVASAVSGVPTPTASAFVGEIGLTGVVRPTAGVAARLSAARAAGLREVFVPEGLERRTRGDAGDGPRLLPVRHVMQALTWATVRSGRRGGAVDPRSDGHRGSGRRGGRVGSGSEIASDLGF